MRQPNGSRYPSRSSLVRAGGQNETTLFCRNQPQATQTARLPDGRAHAVPTGGSPTTIAPAYVAGVHAVLGNHTDCKDSSAQVAMTAKVTKS